MLVHLLYPTIVSYVHCNLATIIILQHSSLLSKSRIFESLQDSFALYQQSGVLDAVSNAIHETLKIHHAHDKSIVHLSEQVLQIIADHSLRLECAYNFICL